VVCRVSVGRTPRRHIRGGGRVGDRPGLRACVGVVGGAVLELVEILQEGVEGRPLLRERVTQIEMKPRRVWHRSDGAAQQLFGFREEPALVVGPRRHEVVVARGASRVPLERSKEEVAAGGSVVCALVTRWRHTADWCTLTIETAYT